MSTFSVGDQVVVPAFGIGIIESIQTTVMEDIEYALYVVKVEENGIVFKVPVDQAEEKGLRYPMSKADVKGVYEVLRDRETPRDKQTWNRRYRAYMTKIKTGDPLQVAEVLRDLAMLKAEKQLSFGERKMYDQAHGLVVQECVIAKELSTEKIEKEIDKIFTV